MYPMYHRKPYHDRFGIIDRMEDMFNRAMIPADGEIIQQSEMVTKYYRVRYEEDGTIKYEPITKEEALKNDTKEG